MFITNSNSFKAAPYLCIYKDCKTDYGSCPLFKECYHDVQKLNKTLLRSEMLSKVLPGETTGDEDDDNVLEFAQIHTVCAIPADERSPDTVNFVKIIDHHINNSEDQIMTDDWSQTIAPGQAFIEGRYFLHQFSGRYESTYTQDQRKVSLCSRCSS